MHKNFFRNIDLWLLVPVLILVTLSLVTLFSLNINFFYGQFALFILSFVFYIIFSQTNYLILKIYAKHIYIASLVVLFAVLLIGIESRGAVRWVEIFGFRLQFSEVLKPFLAISFASYTASIKTLNIKGFLNVFLLLFPIAFLIFLQPDLGNAIIYFIIVLLTLIYLGFPFRYFLISFLPFLLSVPFLWRFLHDYQRQRILTFINPSVDPLGTSYNVIQSIIAVGSGMLMGKGIGQGTQSGLKFLPERQTDFIFATISEQLGFVGVTIILICFAVLLYRVLQIILNTNDMFSKSLSVIVFFAFLSQIFINIAMNLGLLPIVGVTLPFVSYGGSSLLSNFIFLGLINTISNYSKENRVLEIG
ncbi:MAG: rod shape-determining protein RodA [Candidatus Levybacteria bacterium CG10_big_fil_rev_8_21_14_0_10_35_13]|nr:MAG: rod shape-determining protein RodA [Candidatus Levybacteria bacterium CG10_big_fil_rev_8_21_14_0_10_35_13]